MAGMGVGCNSGGEGGAAGGVLGDKSVWLQQKKRGQSPKNCSVTSGMLTC